jgi:CDP-paratose 2-epimerase
VLRLLPVQLALLATEAVAYFATLGMDVVGIDNGMRGEFFGQEASTNRVHSRNQRSVQGWVGDMRRKSTST